MKAVVIVGRSILGSNIVENIKKRKYEIVVFDNFSTGFEKHMRDISRIEIVTGDIKDKDQLCQTMAGCDDIFHLAANVG